MFRLIAEVGYVSKRDAKFAKVSNPGGPDVLLVGGEHLSRVNVHSREATSFFVAWDNGTPHFVDPPCRDDCLHGRVFVCSQWLPWHPDAILVRGTCPHGMSRHVAMGIAQRHLGGIFLSFVADPLLSQTPACNQRNCSCFFFLSVVRFQFRFCLAVPGVLFVWSLVTRATLRGIWLK